MPVNLVPLLAAAGVRALGPGLAVFVGLLLFRVRSSAARYAMWTVVLAGMLLQIPLGMLAPTVPLKALPSVPAPVTASIIQSRVIPGLAAPMPSSVRTIDTRRAPDRGLRRWNGMLTAVYLAISLLLLLRMALGAWGLRRILRDSRPIPDLGRGIFESALMVVPCSVGYIRPRILLPQSWSNWEAVKLRAVLAHERAHIRRHDWLVRFVSEINVCIFWFHPLAWWINRTLARLAEEACDDVAVSEMDKNEYAAALVAIARAAAARGGILNRPVISMATHSNVVQRVNRVLDRRLPVPKPLGRLAWVMLLACSLPVIYLCAAVRLIPDDRASILSERGAIPAASAELPKEQSPAIRLAQTAPNQRVPAPSGSENSSLTMCILIDNSGSMRTKREAVKAAVLALVNSSQPGDEVCMVNFNDEVYFDLPRGEDFTGDVEEMEEALTHVDSRGGKAMRDAVRMSIGHIQQTAHSGRKVLVLVTEGNDSSSTVSQEQLLSEIRDSGVRIYAIGLVSEDDLPKAGTAKLALGQLAQASGGIDYYPRDLAEVETVSPEVANELRKR